MTAAMELRTASLSAVTGSLPLTLPASSACATAVQVTALGRHAVSQLCHHRAFAKLARHALVPQLRIHFLIQGSTALRQGMRCVKTCACLCCRAYAGPHHENYLLRTVGVDSETAVPLGLEVIVPRPNKLTREFLGCTPLISAKLQDITVHTSQQAWSTRVWCFIRSCGTGDCPLGRSETDQMPDKP